MCLEDILGLAQGSAQSRRRQSLVAASLGMVTTQALGACVRLGICEALRDGPRAVDALALAMGARQEALAELLAVLDTLGIVRLTRKGVRLSAKGRLLLADHPGSVAQWVRYAAEFVAPAWMELADVVRGAPPTAHSRRRIYPALDRGRFPARIFHAAMQDTQTEVATALARAIRVKPRELVADLGAGQSTFLVELLKRNPNATAVAIDKFSDFSVIQQKAEERGVASRLRVMAGDFLKPLRLTPDVIVLKNVLADWNDTSVRRILRLARKALPAHGRLYIATTHKHNPPTPEEAVVSLNLRVLTEGGDRHVSDYVELARECHFALTRRTDIAAVAILEFECR